MIVLSGLNQAALFEVVMAIVGVIKPLEIMTKASFSLLPPSRSAASRCRVIEVNEAQTVDLRLNK
jgi:hypothetical protein